MFASFSQQDYWLRQAPGLTKLRHFRVTVLVGYNRGLDISYILISNPGLYPFPLYTKAESDAGGGPATSYLEFRLAASLFRDCRGLPAVLCAFIQAFAFLGTQNSIPHTVAPGSTIQNSIYSTCGPWSHSWQKQKQPNSKCSRLRIRERITNYCIRYV